MKIWITGPQGTCKKELAELLSTEGLKIAHLFTNLSPDAELYHGDLYNHYDQGTISEIFEQGAYIFINDVFDTIGSYDGLDFSEFDNSDIIVLSLDQFTSVNTKYISKDDIIVWLDGRKIWRDLNIDESSNYNIKSRESVEESAYTAFGTFIESLHTSFKNVIYFNEELPCRIKTIIKIMMSSPKLRAEVLKNFYN